MLLIASALASPLVVTDTPLAFPDPAVDVAPADKVPDGWSMLLDAGRLEASTVPSPSGGKAARLSWGTGTNGKVCSKAVPVAVGSTLVVTGEVRADATMTGFGGLHLNLLGANGIVQTAKRRVEPTPDWEDLLVLATVPAGVKTAQLCYEIRGDDNKASYVDLADLAVVERSAESRSAALPTKHIILITVEAFNRSHVHGYGYARDTTPNLDSFTRAGQSFDNHYTTAPYTHPSLASILTGVMPTMLGFTDNTPMLPPALPTLPERMAAAGYVTASFSSQFVLSNRYGLNRGFHYYRNWPNDTTAGSLTAELLPFLGEHQSDNLFLWIHYFDPHGPYRPPAGWREKFTNDALWQGDTMVLGADPKAAEGVAAIPNYVFDKGKLERRWYVAGYDGDIAYWDSELGKLVGWLQTSGWHDDTVVLLTADHGESMTDHGRYFCHGSLWENDVHVPMVAWGKGVAAGGHRTGPTSHLDLMPTILDLAGALPADAPRKSMFVDDPDRLAITTVGKGDALRWSVRDSTAYKVVIKVGGALSAVYDLSKDAGETSPLSGLPAEANKIAQRFRGLLKDGFGEVREVETPTLDDEERERLRALGYLE